jgi:outer membrane receptor protein involved in Fe transport
MFQRSMALWLAGSSLAALGTAAQAQDTVAQPAATAAAEQAAQAAQSEPTGSQDIIVTAQKRAQVLLDVPQSITVVSGKTLEAQHATSFEDYLKLVPGLQLNQDTPGAGRLILRGVNTGGVASTVGVYVDETPFGSSSGLVNGAVLAGDFDTFDVNRIEVLRGPQGTLYGASSLSGVLRFVTNAPSTDRLQVRGRASLEDVAGGDLGWSTNLMVNAPITDNVAFRASGYYRKNPGFIDSIGTAGTDIVGFTHTSDVQEDINDSASYGGRASLLFTPSDRASIRLTAISQDIKVDAPTIVEADPVTLEPLHGLSQSQFVPQKSDVAYRIYNATGEFDLGFADLTSSTSYGTQKQTLRIDLTFPISGFIQLPFAFGGLNLPDNEFIEGQHTNDKKFTQEVRLSDQTRIVDWLVGAYYTDEDGLIAQDFVALQPGTLTPLDLPPIFDLIGGLGFAQIVSNYKELAGFADATFHIAPQFDLELGGRYSHNKQKAHQVTGGALAGASDFVVRSSEDVFTWSVAPKYKVNDHTTLYARVAKGFRPGGPNVLPPGAPQEFATYDSDSIINYEAGIKAESADHRFSVDAAVFHIDWDNIQLLANDAASGFSFNSNGGKAKSDGVEVTLAARPIRGLELSANAAYTNARLTQDTPADTAGRIPAKKGDQLPFTPKFTTALNADYQWGVGGNAVAHFGGSWRHVSGQTAGYDAVFRQTFGHQRHVDAYDVFDLAAGVDFGRFDVQAFVKNLGNSHGVTSTTGTTVFGVFSIFPGGAIGTGIITPRTAGVSVGFDF